MHERFAHLQQETTDKLFSKIQSVREKSEATLFEKFTQKLYGNMPPEDYARTNIEQLYSNASSLWHLSTKRIKGEPVIQIYNPNIDDNGWESDHTIIEIVNDDMPFIVDSIAAAINKAGYTIHLSIHPVIHLLKDKKGTILNVESNGEKDKHATSESFLLMEIDEIIDQKEIQALHDELHIVLNNVQQAVNDWLPMRKKLTEVIKTCETSPSKKISANELSETKEFLKWLEDNNFTFLGYRKYNLVKKKNHTALDLSDKTGLGILNNDDLTLFNGLRKLKTLPADIEYFINDPKYMMLTKTNAVSKIHRAVNMDAVFIKIFDDKGNVIGEHLFIGLFTSTAYNRSVPEIPYFRNKMKQVLEMHDFSSSGHSGKALSHILETYPRDEFFQISVEELYTISKGILHLQDRQRIALFVRKDPFERFLSCLLYVPKDRYDTKLRLKAQALLSQFFKGDVASQAVKMSEGVHAQIHIVINTTPGNLPDFEIEEIEESLILGIRSWQDDFDDALMQSYGERQGKKYKLQFEDAFSPAYQEYYSPKTAVLDISRIENVLTTKELTINLYRPFDADEDEVHFKIYHYGSPLALSDVLPTLENMGVKIETERPFEVICKSCNASVWIHDFKGQTKLKEAVDVIEVRELFQEGFSRIWAGKNEDDGLNRLTLIAGLNWRQIKVLRTYAKYLVQAQFPYTIDIIAETLAKHKKISCDLISYFLTKFNPEKTPQREKIIADIENRITTSLDAVENIDEDKIIRAYLNVMQSTLRTNFFQRDKNGYVKTYISIKIESAKVNNLPLPRPLYEIFVFSPRMEGVHLRGGKVARGGLRWSDRLQDFRTEILGLMKAQMVKNTVIVPMGSKGGFVVKKLPPQSAGREAIQEEVIACYKTLISGLLDITDNIVKGEIIPPENVYRYDQDDPYLVVAADKGTATFSDIANGVSQDYGFWLDDAFASGGSAGYDHKKMGITAKGAWESVKRHFREIGKDIQNEEFTCVGIGDMSGDVFGNGMLLSKKIKLLAAFNHLHIFCDPNPDAAKSFVERERLFNLPRSSWIDYDQKVLSKGGAIFDRSAKSLTLTSEIKACFGIKQDQITPNELLRIILKSNAELLWFGGIGTYIKASDESHSAVGDKANDAIRINGKEVAAKVIGEGANLGVTQYGRIEYALHNKGRINTDAIDNSAGVDTSDHEVNIKILLGHAVQSGDLTIKQRDQILSKMTDDVAKHVLNDNYLQTLCLTFAETQKEADFDNHVKLMQFFEKEIGLNRDVEMLPDDDEVKRRESTKSGFTRPEMAVLLAYAKIKFYQEVLDSDLPKDKFMESYLINYFPTELHTKFRENILQHQLRDEIISTVITNDLINKTNITFQMRAAEITGMTTAEIVRCYLLTKEAFDLEPIYQEVYALDNKVSADIQSEMILIMTRFLQKNVVWLLLNMQHPIDLKKRIASFKPMAQTILSDFENLVVHESQKYWQRTKKHFTSKGVPEKLAGKISALNQLKSGYDIISACQKSESDIKHVAQLYYKVGHHFGITSLRLIVEQMPTKTHWQIQANEATFDDILNRQKLLTLKVLEAAPKEKDISKAIEIWAKDKKNSYKRLKQTIAEIKTLDEIDLAAITVATQHLRALIVND